MKVSLGTLELTEEERRRISASGKPATREQVRDWAFFILINLLDPTQYPRQAQAALRRVQGNYTEFEKARRKRR